MVSLKKTEEAFELIGASIYFQFLLKQIYKKKKRGWKHLSSLILSMHKNGYYKAGEGGFAIVFANDKEAIKIGFYAHDGYPHYLKWCEDKNSKHTPIIYEKHVYEYFYIIRMEKLKSLNSKTVNKILKEKNSLNQLIDEMCEHFQGNNFDIDIHSGNIMQREPSKEYVLTDPLAECNFTLKQCFALS